MIRRLYRIADSSQYDGLPAPAAGKGRGRLGRRPEGHVTVPEGHVPVYVGEEKERFVVRADLLARPAFAELLRLALDEYGYEQRGGLRIPCPVPHFRQVLRSLRASDDYDRGGRRRRREISGEAQEEFCLLSDDGEGDYSLP